jgi:hypothetical protein
VAEVYPGIYEELEACSKWAEVAWCTRGRPEVTEVCPRLVRCTLKHPENPELRCVHVDCLRSALDAVTRRLKYARSRPVDC